MGKAFLYVGVGGFIGSVARYYSSVLFSKLLPITFPFGTLFVNILGCFIIGVLYGLYDRESMLSPEMRLLLATGFCGGFTTFSTFTVESLNLIHDGKWLLMALYVSISVVVGLLATFLGMSLIKWQS